MPSRPPSVDTIASALDDGTLPRTVLVDIARRAVERWRETGEGDPIEIARTEATRVARSGQRAVLNGTGVLLHTNLGRAPLHPRAVEAATAAAAGYTSVEMDLATGSRGRRGESTHRLLLSLTGAEAALVVNNNAGALLLTVAALAGGGTTIVSRGELIEIGGSFRLPEIVSAAGSRSVEVGTTNRTRSKDYRKAISSETASLLLKVHPSNYRVEGFTESVSLADLARLSREHATPLAADIGSGLLDERVPWLEGSPPQWLAGEPGARQAIESGADLVLFSGDKLLGGPQAGIVVGTEAAVSQLAAHPIARTVRIGPAPLAALEATLALYASGRAAEIPFWHMATLPAGALRDRLERLIDRVGTGTIIEGISLPGAGSVPGHGIPGPVAAFTGDASRMKRTLLDRDPPVVARIDGDALVVDLRTIAPIDDATVAEALSHACR